MYSVESKAIKEECDFYFEKKKKLDNNIIEAKETIETLIETES